MNARAKCKRRQRIANTRGYRNERKKKKTVDSVIPQHGNSVALHENLYSLCNAILAIDRDFAKRSMRSGILICIIVGRIRYYAMLSTGAKTRRNEHLYILNTERYTCDVFACETL